MSKHTNSETFASPGFCRIERYGIHFLNRYKGAHRLPWDEIRAVEKPCGNCRDDYLKVVKRAWELTHAIAVAERDHAEHA